MTDDVESDDMPDTDLNKTIDLWLAEDRPDRYDPTARDWMNHTVERVAELLKARKDRDRVIEDHARGKVYKREGEATKAANRTLRDIATTGALPIGWGKGETWDYLCKEVLSQPLSIAKRIRIRLAAISPAELDQWVAENAREEDLRMLAQIQTRQGGRMLANWEREQGVQRVDNLR